MRAWRWFARVILRRQPKRTASGGGVLDVSSLSYMLKELYPADGTILNERNDPGGLRRTAAGQEYKPRPYVSGGLPAASQPPCLRCRTIVYAMRGDMCSACLAVKPPRWRLIAYWKWRRGWKR